MSKINLSKDRRSDMLCGALEGGSNYWYDIDEANTLKVRKYGPSKTPFVDRMIEALYAGETISINDLEDPDVKLGEINLASMDKGEELMFEKQPRHYGDIISEDDDASTADVWFQFCVLSDLIYG